MSHFRRKAPKKTVSHGACYMCKPQKMAGNGGYQLRHFRAVVARDPLLDYQTRGRHKVAA